jgi:hypothetical protein
LLEFREIVFNTPIVWNTFTDAFDYVRQNLQLLVQYVYFMNHQKLETGDRDWLSSSAGAHIVQQVTRMVGKGDRSTLALDSLIASQVTEISITVFPRSYSRNFFFSHLFNRLISSL